MHREYRRTPSYEDLSAEGKMDEEFEDQERRGQRLPVGVPPYPPYPFASSSSPRMPPSPHSQPVHHPPWPTYPPSSTLFRPFNPASYQTAPSSRQPSITLHNKNPSLQSHPYPSAASSQSPSLTRHLPSHIALPLSSSSSAQSVQNRKKKIYVGGKMMFYLHPKRDWRGLLRFKEYLQSDCSRPTIERQLSFAHLELEFNDTWTYVGPFFLYCAHDHHEYDWFYCMDDYHAPAPPQHPEQREFIVDEAQKQLTLENCFGQISKCDVFYTRIDTTDNCYSLLQEIGFALASGKRIYIDCLVDGFDSWIFKSISKKSGATDQEYNTIPWALFKDFDYNINSNNYINSAPLNYPNNFSSNINSNTNANVNIYNNSTPFNNTAQVNNFSNITSNSNINTNSTNANNDHNFHTMNTPK